MIRSTRAIPGKAAIQYSPESRNSNPFAIKRPREGWVTGTPTPRNDRVASSVIAPAMLIVERDQLERYPWHEVADEFVYPGAPEGELRVRLAMLRRRSGVGDGSVIRLGALALDTETYRVTANGRSLDLTFKEFELLQYLMRREGQVVPRDSLALEVWSESARSSTLDNVIDVHIARLRRKIDLDQKIKLIHTIRGVGFVLQDGEP